MEGPPPQLITQYLDVLWTNFISFVANTNFILGPEGKNESQPVLEGNEHYKLEMNDKPEENTLAAGYQQVADGKLVIDKARLSDRGNFYCIGTSDIMAGEQAKVETFVRVKGKLAALWPFIGICAEVFVLCAIILIYEKRRNKTDLDESDTDQSPDQ